MTLANVVLAWILAKLFADHGSKSAPYAPAPSPAPSPSTAMQVPTATPATYTPPWPSAKPKDLPPFPGIDWEPDNPPPPEVVQRAAKLLPTLWAHGEGTSTFEQTGGRWIAYRATAMGSKKGVVAYRLKPTAAPAPAAMPIPEVPHVVTTSAPAAATPASSAPSPVTLQTLRIGSKGTDVQVLQQHLGIKADGIFGPQTQAAVKTFQALHGLTADGVVGPKTWGALFSAAA